MNNGILLQDREVAQAYLDQWQRLADAGCSFTKELVDENIRSESEKNDENFVVIQGNRKLAEAYAVQCLATYDHYRWRAYVNETLKDGGKVWSHLSSDPGWQEEYLSPERKRHLDIWCR